VNDPIDRSELPDHPELLDCQDLVELVTDYLDGALPPERRRVFDAHLSDCDGCVHHLEQFRIAIRLSRAAADVLEVPIETMSVLEQAFRAKRPSPDHPV
jgi:anti-sigma factor RsiW